jgi:hypothetical protein
MAHTSSFVGTRVIDCGENLEQLKKPDKCIDVDYIDSASHSEGTFKQFWREYRDKLAASQQRA